MSYHVIVSFGEDKEYEMLLHDADVDRVDEDQAHDWLAEEFDVLECVPTHPMGKVLLLDMILNVAKYGGEERFRNGSDWAREFAVAVCATLQRPVIRVDVARFVVG